MPKRYDVAVKVLSIKGTCSVGHKVGEEWIIKNKTPEGICYAAFLSLSPHIWALMFGSSFPWETESGVVATACPDPDNPVVFELRRI
jgi:uncharacterized repeat protein (TIGR04076 family)